MTEETKPNNDAKKEIPKSRWALDRDILDLEQIVNPIREQISNRQNEIYQLKKEIADSVARELLGEPYVTLEAKMQESEKFRKENFSKPGFNFNDHDKKHYELPGPYKNKFLAVMQEFNDEQRLVVAYALDLKEMLRFSCYNDFDHYKTPTECGKCIEGYENLQRAVLIKYFKFVGERVYKSDREKVQKIIFGMVPKLKDSSLKATYQERIKNIDTGLNIDEKEYVQAQERLKKLKEYKEEENKKLNSLAKVAREDVFIKLQQIIIPYNDRQREEDTIKGYIARALK